MRVVGAGGCPGGRVGEEEVGVTARVGEEVLGVAGSARGRRSEAVGRGGSAEQLVETVAAETRARKRRRRREERMVGVVGVLEEGEGVVWVVVVGFGGKVEV